MKNRKPIRALLGITQLDAAMLLRVHLSQWSMFECGQRNLPSHAMKLLFEMIAYVNSREASHKPTEFHFDDGSLNQLERMLIENEYQQALVQQKIALIEKKLKMQRRVSHLSDFLNDRTENGKADAAHQHIIEKAAKATANHPTSDLLKYQIRNEVLEYEKHHLESKIQLIQSANEINRTKE